MRSDSSPTYLLGADVGGTKTLLRLVRVDGNDGKAETVAQSRFESADWPGLAPLLRAFLAGRPSVSAACVAAACPVESRRVRLTNLEFWIDADEIARECAIPQVRLVNDFVAVGYGIETLAPSDLLTLQAGVEKPAAARALLGAGTGLGEALLVWQGSHYEVVASEGGHVDFAPTDETQIGLLRFLMARHGHVSYERILSGCGLVAVFEYLARGTPLGADLAAAVRAGDAAAISDAALKENDPLATQALDLFLRIYGAQAGNLALTAWARGGVYVAGGIAARILPRMGNGVFLDGFRDKGRYRDVLASMPVRVVTDPAVGLAGAVAAAGRLAAAAR